MRETWFPWIGKIPCRRAWQPTPIFLPGHSSWTEEAGRLKSLGSQRVRHNRVTEHSSQSTYSVTSYQGTAWRRKVAQSRCTVLQVTRAQHEEAKSLSRVQLFATPWTVACQAPLSMGFSRQEYWNGLPFPSPGDLHNSGIKPRSPAL